MILLALFGGLMLVLSAFYLVNSWQRYREWKWATCLVVISLALTIFGVVELPYWHHSKSSAASSSSSSIASGSTSSISLTTGMSSSSSVSQSAKEDAILSQLQKAYSKMGTVAYDSASKTYEITVTDSDEKKALQEVLDDPSQAEDIGWPKLAKSLRSTSKQIKANLGSGYSLTLLQPGSSQAMYTAKDGQESYTAVNN